jgi:hypothetical protein
VGELILAGELSLEKDGGMECSADEWGRLVELDEKLWKAGKVDQWGRLVGWGAAKKLGWLIKLEGPEQGGMVEDVEQAKVEGPEQAKVEDVEKLMRGTDKLGAQLALPPLITGRSATGEKHSRGPLILGVGLVPMGAKWWTSATSPCSCGIALPALDTLIL